MTRAGKFIPIKGAQKRLKDEGIAKEINIKPMPSRGIIRLVIRLDYPNKDPEDLSFDEMLHVFKNGLKAKLGNIGIDNNSSIVNKMVSELTKNQSLFIMVRV